MDQQPLSPDLPTAVLTDHCHLRIPSLPDWVEPTVDYLVRRATLCGAVHAGRATRIMLALHEALTNSIIHGNLGISSELKLTGDRAFAEAVATRCGDPAYYLRGVDIQAHYDGERARWVFTDEGDGFDFQDALRRVDDDDLDPLRPFGRGMLLMRAFVDEMRYEEGGRRLVLAVRREEGKERRVHTRMPFLRNVRVTPVDASGAADWPASREVVAHDLSAQGIGFLQDRLDSSTRVLITIPTESGRSISLPAEVRHWHSLGDQIVEVGCRFEARMPVPQPDALPASDDPTARALHELLQRLGEQQKPAEERRSAPRFPYTEALTVRLPDGSTVPGYGRDLSRTGIAFFTSQPVPLDTVRLALPAHDGSEIVAHARVVRCTCLLDGFHDVAACFVSS
jgi:anti-sigma regulatory factor (Ser/Thr protein kinase)